MKRVIRIMSVILLILFLLVVGYVSSTCSRFKSNKTQEELKITSYYSQDKSTTLIITDDYMGEYVINGNQNILEFQEFTDNVIKYSDGENEYLFTVLDNGDLFDTNTKKLLIRSNKNEKTNSV